jgi:hypothetical protein
MRPGDDAARSTVQRRNADFERRCRGEGGILNLPLLPLPVLADR